MGPDYELGVQRLRTALLQQSSELPSELELLETRLRRNMNEARRYGDDPTNRVEWNKIIDGFIQLTNELLRMSFNDLCRPELEMIQPEVPPALLKELVTAKEQGASKGGDEFVSESSDILKYNGTQNRWAVLVGVDAYEDSIYPSLSVCTQDLGVISQQLSASGFIEAHMHVLADCTPELPTRENILTTLRMVAQATKAEGSLAFLLHWTWRYR